MEVRVFSTAPIFAINHGTLTGWRRRTTPTFAPCPSLALKGLMMSKRYQILALLALLLPALSACNTFEGLGQDVQKAGSSLEKAADKNK